MENTADKRSDILNLPASDDAQINPVIPRAIETILQ